MIYSLSVPVLPLPPTELIRAVTDAEWARHVAHSYHCRVHALYQSDRASIVWGRGGTEGYDAKAYAKSYRAKFGGARWRDAGVRILYEHPTRLRPATAIVENYRGTEVARIPLPDPDVRDRCEWDGLLDGDLWAVARQVGGAKVLERWGIRRKKLVRTGLALWVTGRPLPGLEQGWWEHGTDLTTIRAEVERKIELARTRAQAQAESHRVARAAGKIARLCGQLVVGLADAANCGYCAAGTSAFRERFGLAGDSATVSQLRATGDDRVEKPIQAAALRLARQRFGAVAATA